MIWFKGTVSLKFFASGFFHGLSSPKPLKITSGPFKFFRKFTEIFASQGAPLVSTTKVANFATSTAGVVDTRGKFATGVNDTCSKFVLSCKYLREFSKKFETALIVLEETGSWKNLNTEISWWHCPFKGMKAAREDIFIILHSKTGK